MKLRIEKAIYGSAGLARHEGKAIFVAQALPGELVEAEITSSKASYAEARVMQVLEASAERVTPPCPYYGACGGCQYQHARYAEQLRMKAAILKETLGRARLGEIPAIQTVAGEPAGYRNRIRLHVQKKPFALGYLRGQSHVVLPVDACLIAAPVLVHAMRVLANECESELAEWASEVEFFTGDKAERVLVSVYARAKTAGLQSKLHTLWKRLQAVLPEAAGCTAFAVPAGKGFARRVAAAGEDALIYRVSDAGYRVSAGSFFQVNRFLLEHMVSVVCDEHSGATGWDLYAGVGLFAKPLTQRFEDIVAVEAAPESVADLRVNIEGNKPRAHVVAATTLDFLRKTVRDAKKLRAPDYVVVDPPRAGLGKEVTALLGEIKAPHITYVSCDPATLSRDLSALLQSGYRFRSLHMVDLFPQTFHLETIVQLSLA